MSEVPPDTIVTRPQVAGSERADPGQPRALVLLGVVRRTAHRGTRLGVRAGDEHAARAAVEQGAHDRLDLGGLLALRQHRLGRALAQLAVGVHAREAKIVVGQAAQLLEGGGCGYLAALDRGEQFEDPRL